MWITLAGRWGGHVDQSNWQCEQRKKVVCLKKERAALEERGEKGQTNMKRGRWSPGLDEPLWVQRHRHPLKLRGDFRLKTLTTVTAERRNIWLKLNVPRNQERSTASKTDRGKRRWWVNNQRQAAANVFCHFRIWLGRLLQLSLWNHRHKHFLSISNLRRAE